MCIRDRNSSSPATGEPVLAFDDATGQPVEFDLRLDGPIAGPKGRGRPKLGVTAREVTLLPRHWDWLASQPGGASTALRRLVEQARRAPTEQRRLAREAAYRFMTAMAGDHPGYEQATRALFAGDRDSFRRASEPWPADVGAHARRLAAEAFDDAAAR